VLEWARSVSAPGDTFFVTNDAAFAWRYYSPRLGLGDRPVLEAAVDESPAPPMVDELLARRPRGGRVFFFTTHYYADGDSRAAALQEFAKRNIHVVRSFEATSASVSELEFPEE